MKNSIRETINKTSGQFNISCCIVALLASTPIYAKDQDKIFAFIADEHNTSLGTPTGNRNLSIDIESMQLIQSLDVPGILNHHADNSFNSKIYSIPKGSGYINVVTLTKNENNTPEMEITKQIKLIHSPRSGDAYNQKYGIILVTAKNRPMGSFIDVKTDEVIGTIGENVDCKLTTGGELLNQPNPNSTENSTKYQCSHTDYGGNQISGHPYWLTTDYAAIVDRSNRQISVYKVWKEEGLMKSRLVNHLPTRSSIHQIVPRDRTQLPRSEQADFYAIEEGSPKQGIPPALIKMKLTTNGLILEKRINLGRTESPWNFKYDHVLEQFTEGCSEIENGSYWNDTYRYYDYQYHLLSYGLDYTRDEAYSIEKPMACLSPSKQGAHNADFAPDNKHLYIGSREGSMFIVNVDQMKIMHNINTGSGYGNGSSPGHTTFAADKNIAIVTNHTAPYLTAINIKTQKKIKDIPLPFTRENIFNSVVSHSAYIDKNEHYYYNTWTDGGVFFNVNLDTLSVESNIYTGGIPIQGSYISTASINYSAPEIPFVITNDNAATKGEIVVIDVLENDTGDELVISGVSTPGNGQIAIVNGTIEYTPRQSFSGTEKLWYNVVDAYDVTKRGLITISVESSVSSVPVEAYSDSATTSGSPIDIDVLANDKGSDLYFGTIYSGYYGLVTNNNGILRYTPVDGFTGSDFFWYEIIDAAGQSAWGRVTIEVTSGDFSIADETVESDGATITIDVLANDTGSGLHFGTVYNGYYGQIKVNGEQISYTPQNDYSGEDFFYYEVIDESGRTGWGKVVINIDPNK